MSELELDLSALSAAQSRTRRRRPQRNGLPRAHEPAQVALARLGDRGGRSRRPRDRRDAGRAASAYSPSSASSTSAPCTSASSIGLPQVEQQKVVPPGERVSVNQSPFPLLRSPLLGPPDAVYTDGATLTQVFGKPGAARLLHHADHRARASRRRSSRRSRPCPGRGRRSSPSRARASPGSGSRGNGTSCASSAGPPASRETRSSGSADDATVRVEGSLEPRPGRAGSRARFADGTRRTIAV